MTEAAMLVLPQTGGLGLLGSAVRQHGLDQGPGSRDRGWVTRPPSVNPAQGRSPKPSEHRSSIERLQLSLTPPSLVLFPAGRWEVEGCAQGGTETTRPQGRPGLPVPVGAQPALSQLERSFVLDLEPPWAVITVSPQGLGETSGGLSAQALGSRLGSSPWSPEVAGTQKSRALASPPRLRLRTPSLGGGQSAPLGRLPPPSLPTECPSQWDPPGQGPRALASSPAQAPVPTPCRRRLS
ncbi:proline-rich protein HaeIII subfamily 1-like [Moschus berezovskii]|uniref:proline-rich protein HaeIII subfamily 1-like n=1 Tax=Moschus berezovskii TaxID=68408 RepID=UPI0024452067|nr:proline-rich protein HaeIII subfamily 1-like [Moschus berezovskii]